MKTTLFMKILLCASALAAAGCASRSAKEILEEKQSLARPRAAAYGADGFYSDGKFPERNQPPPGEFFFKHCTLSGRNPYPSASDWECTEPR